MRFNYSDTMIKLFYTQLHNQSLHINFNILSYIALLTNQIRQFLSINPIGNESVKLVY